MTVKEELERLEHKRLNPLAAFADQSKGRPRQEEPREEDVRTSISGTLTELSTARPSGG